MELSCKAVIEAFDQFVILLKNSVNQMVYKHAISTIVPAKNVSIADHNHTEEEVVEPGNV